MSLFTVCVRGARCCECWGVEMIRLGVNGVFVYSACRGTGALLDVFRNPYFVNEIKVNDGCNKSHIHYDFSS